jgi:riboflavin biosynthesis pyrimidine reductase
VTGPALQLLWPAARAGEVIGVDDAEPVLADLYAYPPDAQEAESRRWVRANMVATLDGAAYGHDRRTGSINSAADFRVFVALRALADVVLVGAGTVRDEGYGLPRVRPALAARRAAAGQAPAPALAMVTRSGRVPEDQGLFDGDDQALVVTCAAAGEPALSRLRDLAGHDGVLVAGDEAVDLSLTLELLADRGLTRVLCEGGPTLLTALADAGLLDELCLTWTPTLVGGGASRILGGPVLDVSMQLDHLLHADGTLVGRWTRRQR